MTEKENRLLSVFENRVHQLISLYTELKIQMESLQLLYSKLEQENKILKDKYDNLRITQIISIKQDDFKCAKNKFAQLVKKIDECIALLNE